MRRIVLLICSAIILTMQAQAKVIFVNGAIPAAGDGSSWATAKKIVQEAIDIATASDEIWVKKGAYYSNAANDFVLVLKEGVAVYGGFTGTETALDQRDWQNNTTILYALQYNAVSSAGLTSASILDGFTIAAPDNQPTGSRGIYNQNSAPLIRNCTFLNLETRAGASTLDFNGAAIYNDNSSPTIVNCSFLNNISLGKGGAIYNTNGSTVDITHSTFTGNQSAAGGALYNNISTVTISNCNISQNANSNRHANQNGGALYNLGGSCTVVNSVLAGNTSSSLGGAIYNFGCNLTLVNCTLTQNTSLTNVGGAALYYAGSTIQSDPSEIINNTIIWGNTPLNPWEQEVYSDVTPVTSASIIAGGLFGATDTAPIFTSGTDFRLQANSPGINDGNTDFAAAYGSLDLADKARVYDDTIDMGAYELQVTTNVVTNNGTSSITGFTGSLDIAGKNTPSDRPQIYEWSLRLIPADAQGDTTTVNINPADLSSFAAILSSQGIIIDSNHLAVTDLSQLPSVMAVLDPGTAAIWNHFSGTVLVNRRINTDNLSNTLLLTVLPAALPVTIASFMGTWQNGMAVLLWVSGAESNFNRFELEKSTDGKNFVQIANLAAKGSNSMYHYSIRQSDVVAYYRLKWTSNGRPEWYNQVVTLEATSVSNQLLVYPNPAENIIHIKVAAQGLINIYDASGKAVKIQKLAAGINAIDISDLAAGVYYAIINGQKLTFLKNK